MTQPRVRGTLAIVCAEWSPFPAASQPRYVQRAVEQPIFDSLRSGRSVALTGPAGSGKTALSLSIAARWDGNVVRLTPQVDDLQHAYHPNNPLFIIDDVETATDEERSAVFERLPQTGLLFALGRSGFAGFSGEHFRLGGLTDAEISQLLSSSGFDASLLTRIGETSWSRSPRALTLLMNHLLRHGDVAAAQLLDTYRQRPLFEALDEVTRYDTGESTIVSPRHALLGPDGELIQSGSGVGAALIDDVREISDELIGLLARKPHTLFQLTPQRFEQLVAELLSRQGYETTLTAASNDGGYDIFAARKDAVGSFLYLVECKRYSPDNPVGVSIVRSLHGVVESRRATAGLIATTSRFTAGASAFQKQVPFRLALRDFIAIQDWLQLVAGDATLSD